MENFDPIGRWRANYPIYTDPPDGSVALEEEFYSTKGKGGRWGPEIDPSTVLPDGTRLGDVTDLKRYLLENIDLFFSLPDGKAPHLRSRSAPGIWRPSRRPAHR